MTEKNASTDNTKNSDKKTELRFYHLERSPLAQMLPALITKAVQSGKKCVVQTCDARAVKNISNDLWAHHPDSFLAHGSAKDGSAARQPIWVTDKDENPNDADVLILTHGARRDDMDAGGFSLCCILFDGTNADALNGARAQWKIQKERGVPMTYWQQADQGWVKKAQENIKDNI